jgi:Dyp-type peroxidase family
MQIPETKVVAPHEPVLELSDIQGLVVPGFLKPHFTLLGGRFPRDAAGSIQPPAVLAFKQRLSTLVDEFDHGARTLEDRRAHRRFVRGNARNATNAQVAPKTTLVGLAFAASGLRALTPGAADIPSPAFQAGLVERSAFLGDPTDPAHEGNPARWKVGAPGGELDMFLVVAGDEREAVDTKADELANVLTQLGIEASYGEAGDVRPDMPGHEHFGFDDGISQPGIRGRASAARDDFLTERWISPSQTPEAWLFGLPGQDLVWPGEFVLGYARTSPDPLTPGLLSPTVPTWTRNGSFLVFRRMRQDVGLFWRTMRDLATSLRHLPGFDALTDEYLAAHLVGRWMSGAPVNRVPDADNPDLGGDRLANNHFRFNSPTTAVPLVEADYVDSFPQAAADPAGIVCPWAAHIRKVNTRDAGSDMGGQEATYSRRVLRRGIAFGPPLADRYAEPSSDPANGERGLLFMSVQASIEDQFEFLVARWMNDPTRPKTPAGHDLVIGQNAAPGAKRVRDAVLFGSGLQQSLLSTSNEWVIPTGGGYFFVPSLSAIRHVLAV